MRNMKSELTYLAQLQTPEGVELVELIQTRVVYHAYLIFMDGINFVCADVRLQVLFNMCLIWEY